MENEAIILESKLEQACKEGAREAIYQLLKDIASDTQRPIVGMFSHNEYARVIYLINTQLEKW